MNSSFLNNYTDFEDPKLVDLSIKGDKKALQTLIIRHQLFVYNLALKMAANVQDAEDLTQEVFIKIITALSKFTTWLYRITVNHFLNSKKKYSKLKVVSFETYFNSIDAVPSFNLNEQEEKNIKIPLKRFELIVLRVCYFACQKNNG